MLQVEQNNATNIEVVQQLRSSVERQARAHYVGSTR